jgi:hypothetical protein
MNLKAGLDIILDERERMMSKRGLSPCSKEKVCTKRED